MVDTYIADNTDVFLSEILIATAIAGLIISIILMISYYKIFKKNQVKGWKAIIPIYNVYTLMKIAEINPLSIFLLLVPIVNLFVMALVSVKLANKYNKGALFAIGLLFLPFICYPILALSKVENKKEKIGSKEKIDLKEKPKEVETKKVENNFEKVEKENNIKKEVIEEPKQIKEEKESNIEQERLISKKKAVREESTAFKEILKVNDYKKMEEKKPIGEKENEKTLDEILQVNSTPYKEKNEKESKIRPPEKSNDLNEEVDKLLKLMKKINKEEEAKEEKEEALKDSYICESCGSIVPRFAKKCLLCGSDKMKK